MKRAIVIIALLAGLPALIWVSRGQDHQIVVTEATISKMMDGSVMAGAVVTNGGAPDVLISAEAEGFGHVHFMGADGALVVPGASAPVLAGDGAHIMMSGGADLAIGQLVPIVLQFENAGQVTARAKITDAMMDHAAMAGIEAPDVSLNLQTDGPADRDGLTGRIEVDGLTLISRANDAPHAEGEGHAHLYLNGLKLKRLYAPEFETGRLLPGRYVLSVSLNANDHRPYLASGSPLIARYEFSVK